jgi:hypothetical protein
MYSCHNHSQRVLAETQCTQRAHTLSATPRHPCTQQCTMSTDTQASPRNSATLAKHCRLCHCEVSVMQKGGDAVCSQLARCLTQPSVAPSVLLSRSYLTVQHASPRISQPNSEHEPSTVSWSGANTVCGLVFPLVLHQYCHTPEVFSGPGQK